MSEQPLMKFKNKEEAVKMAKDKGRYLEPHVVLSVYEVEGGLVIRFAPKPK